MLKASSPVSKNSSTSSSRRSQQSQNLQLIDWKAGDRVVHPAFGLGEITHVLGEGEKVNLAIKFSGLGRKIIDPRNAKLQRLD